MQGGDTAKETPYRLSRPALRGEWEAFREIRRRVDFEAPDADEGHADDLAPGCYPLLLCHHGKPVGAIRIDSLDGGGAAFRLVAVHPECQGKGHGRALLREAEAFARDIGCRKAVVYSTVEAAGFYASAGYAEDVWDEEYFGGVVMMTKALHYAGFVRPEDEEAGAEAADKARERLSKES
jgi:GNAT superfamily N-acetyltransferase